MGLKQFRHFKLKTKLIAISLLGVVLLSIVFAGQMFYTLAQYEQELYKICSVTTTFLGNTIQTEFQGVSYLGDSMAADTTILSNLTVINDKNVERAKYAEAYIDIYNKSLQFLASNDNILSVTFVTDSSVVNCGEEFLLGDAGKNRGESLVSKGNGQAIMNTLREDEVEWQTYLVRQIRTYQGNQLGMLYMELNIKQIIDRILTQNMNAVGTGEFVLIDNENHVVYTSMDRTLTKESIMSFTEIDAYRIQEMNDKQVFISKGKLESYGWTSYFIVDYDSVFGFIHNLKIKNMAVVLIFIAVIVVLTHYLVSEVISHFKYLIVKMKEFEKGEFTPIDVGVDYKERFDEVGELHRRFDEMVVRFSELIDDNYKKQIELQDTKIRMLEQQIDPHFLYNTLESMNLLALSNGETKLAMMAQSLGSLFRSVIKEEREVISLERESNILNNYIFIQMIRFENKLEIKNLISEGYYDLEIPKVSLQPLVENAIKYGLEYNMDVCKIVLSLQINDGIVNLSVSNTGSYFDQEKIEEVLGGEAKVERSGIGLYNIHSRLKLLYGNEYGLRIKNEGEYAVVTMIYPEKYISRT